MSRQIRTLIPIIWLMALLLLPATAYFFGVRQPTLENRAKTEFPVLDQDTVRQDETFKQLDAAIRDRLPLRGQAVKIRGRITANIFGDSLSEEVIIGEDDWLYYRLELLICEPEGQPIVPPEDAIEVLTKTIAASGRKPVVTVAGSKIVTHPEHLKGVDDGDLACLRNAEARVQERLEEIPGGFSIQAELDALEAAGKPTFLRSDTHWNALGREVFVRNLLNQVNPGLAREVRLRAIGEIDRSGDLGPFLGQDRVDRDRQLTVTRRPETQFDPGEILIVGDSQLWNSMKIPGADGKTILDHVFPGQPLCDQYEMQIHGCAEPMLGVETVVIESVARNFQLVEQTCSKPVAALASTVRGLPARWADGDPVRRAVTSTPASARVVLDADRSGVLRLLRIPVIKFPAESAVDSESSLAVSVVPNGSPRPCAVTTVSDYAAEIVIPIPADERIVDVDLEISGPEGSKLGRPEVLVLNGRALTPRR